MTDLTTMMDRALNPALLGWPPMLPVELALRERPVQEVCEAHGIDVAKWGELKQNANFVKAVEAAVAEMKRDGMGFKVKARLQAEAMLTKSWNMINQPDAEVSPTVKADLIKSTVKWAGLDGSRELAGGSSVGTALQININLG